MSKNEVATTSAEEVTVEDINRQVFLAPFSDDRAWDEVLVSTEIRSLVHINMVCVVEIGKRLICAKNNIPHGRWLEFLESVNVPRFAAARYMRAAQKMLEHPKLKQLEAAGVSKLDEILRADDEDLQDFEDSGVFMGKTADQLAAMTRDELKALVRDKQQRLEQSKQQFEQQDQQITDLQEQVSRLKGAPVEREVFYQDVHESRRNIFGELESYVRHVDESKDVRETIAVFNLVHQLETYCEYLAQQLIRESDIGGLLVDTTAAYDAPYLQTTDLGEIADHEAADLGLDDTGDDK